MVLFLATGSYGVLDELPMSMCTTQSNEKVGDMQSFRRGIPTKV
jgi:hypothetical protein